MGAHRIVEDGRRIMQIEQKAGVEIDRGRGKHGDRHLGNDELSEINLHGAPTQAQEQRPHRQRRRSVRLQPQRPAGEKDEEFGGIRKRQIAIGEMFVKNAGNMVEEDRDEGEAAPEIDLVRFPHGRSGSCRGQVRSS